MIFFLASIPIGKKFLFIYESMLFWDKISENTNFCECARKSVSRSKGHTGTASCWTRASELHISTIRNFTCQGFSAFILLEALFEVNRFNIYPHFGPCSGILLKFTTWKDRSIYEMAHVL